MGQQLTEEWLSILDDEAKARAALHANHASNRPMSEGYETVGLVGEAQFACDFHQPLDWERRPGGDNGCDFIVPFKMIVDVKTFRRPFHLIVEPGKVHRADIYVLAGYSDETLRAELLGWEWRQAVERAPVKKFEGIDNHYIAAGQLRPMEDLHRRIMRLV